MNSNSHSHYDRPEAKGAELDEPGERDQGTIRMEAFVDTSYKDGVLYVPPLPTTRPSMRLRGSSQRSSGTVDTRRPSGYVMDDAGRDPFTEF